MSKTDKYIAILLIFVVGIFTGQLWVMKQFQGQQEEMKLVIKVNSDMLRLSFKKLEKLKNRIDQIEKLLPFKSEIFIATAYCNDEICINVSKWHDGKTAMGTVARIGIIAVDPKIIPLGSKVFIERYGWFRAEDTGGKIKGKKIDIFMDNYKAAKQFGRRKVVVFY